MTRWNWRAVALAAPGCALGAGLAVALAGAVFERNPIWPDHRLTLAEAVATRAEADMVRLLREGHDPNTLYDVRPDLLADRAVRITPLEAAAIAGAADLMERLLRHVNGIDAAAWTRLRCLAGGGDLTALLERHRPAGVMVRCDGISPP